MHGRREAKVEQSPHCAARSEPRAHEARGGASPERPESDRRPHHGVCRVDELRVPAHSAVRCLMLFLEGKPWPTLTLVVSLEAIFLSTFVMISQNRADEKRQV